LFIDTPRMKLVQQKSSRILKISSAHSKSVSMMNFEERFRDSIDPAQINLVLDLDDSFFANSYQLVQSLSDRNPFLAAKFKLYVDILSRLHGHYCNEVDQGKALQLKVKTADEKLKLALKTTATSEAMMESLRESLEESWRNEDATKSREETMQMQLMSLVQTDQPISNRAMHDAPIINA